MFYSDYCEKKVIVGIYQCIVHTRLLYGIETWAISRQLLKMMEFFHRSCMRCLTGDFIRKMPDGEWISKYGGSNEESKPEINHGIHQSTKRASCKIFIYWEYPSDGSYGFFKYRCFGGAGYLVETIPDS